MKVDYIYIISHSFLYWKTQKHYYNWIRHQTMSYTLINLIFRKKKSVFGLMINTIFSMWNVVGSKFEWKILYKHSKLSSSNSYFISKKNKRKRTLRNFIWGSYTKYLFIFRRFFKICCHYSWKPWLHLDQRRSHTAHTDGYLHKHI